jgi:DNA-binding LacI/PurR family transcriptional regulator
VVESAEPADVKDAVERALEPAAALIVVAFERPGQAALAYAPADVPVAGMVPSPAEDEKPSRPCVWIDEYSAAKEATQYLLALGHQTVHHLSIPTWTGTTRRMSGWRSALEDAGADVPEPRLSGWTLEWGYEAGLGLAGDPAVTAVLCGNDDIALGVMRAMHEAGRPVPAEVSIIGFDDVPFARFCTPALTTVRQDFKALGKVCFATLLSVLGQNPPKRLEHPKARLVRRESAGPPPVARRRRPGKNGGPTAGDQGVARTTGRHHAQKTNLQAQATRGKQIAPRTK